MAWVFEKFSERHLDNLARKEAANRVCLPEHLLFCSSFCGMLSTIISRMETLNTTLQPKTGPTTQFRTTGTEANGVFWKRA